VLRPPLLGEAEEGLVDDLVAAAGANGGVLGRRIESDRDQRRYLGTVKT
jgi:hypothetical protein